ncbi:MAG: STAS domain-containing protein [Pseudomonadota bacterium]
MIARNASAIDVSLRAPMPLLPLGQHHGVAVDRSSGGTRVSLIGRIDAATASALEAALADAADADLVTVDTASVEHMGSAGLRALLRGACLLESKGKQLFIERASKDLVDLMHLTGMDRVLAVRPCALAA